MTERSTDMFIRSSYHQERLWFIDRFETENIYPAQPTYHNMPLMLYFRDAIDRQLLEQSINFVVGKHEALRTTIVTRGETPIQAIRDSVEIKLHVEDFPKESFDAENPAQAFRILQESLKSFPLDGNALLFAKLFIFADEASVLLLTVHHIIADRHSIDAMAAEILTVYGILIAGGTPISDGPDLQYADVAEWERGLAPADWEPFLFYWKRQLAGPLQALELPTDRPRAPIQTYAPGQVQFTVKRDLYQRIESFGGINGLQSQDIFMGAFILLLHRYSGLREINIGNMRSNRWQVGTDGVLGPLSNLVAIRANVDAAATTTHFFSELKRVTRDAEKYQSLAYERLVLELAPAPDMSRTALFDVLFMFEHTEALTEICGLTVEKVENNFGLGKYDLNLLIKEHTLGATGYLVFNTDLYNESTIQRFVGQYTNLLESITLAANATIRELDILDAEERAILLYRWNDTDTIFPIADTLVSLFEKTATIWPSQVALEQNGRLISYQELNRSANQLAQYLIEVHQVKKGDRVGLSLEKSLQMIVSLLAILKAGAAYIPIDPVYPRSRKEYMLQDIDCRLLLVDREIELSTDLMTIDLSEVDCGEFSYANREVDLEPDDPAYIIYTSGSTGMPKGCGLSHRNVVRLMKNDRHDFDFTENDIWIMVHSLSFDFSVWEIWGALLYGARLIIPTGSQSQDLAQLYRLIVESRVTVLNQTPDSFYHLCTLAQQDNSHDLASHLRYVVFGGAKLDPTRLNSWVQKYPLSKIRLINMYGITETTVHVTFYALEEQDILSGYPACIIGRPLPETKVYILDNYGQPSPVGVWGTIHVGGTGVGQGYLNRPELTKQKFFERPALTQGCLYDSGDIGRWLETGVIEYQGRRDNQIKIRGFRIEGAEVAFYLKKHQGIREAVVVSRVNLDATIDELVAYYTAIGEQDRGLLPPEDLRKHLIAYLPSYMIPSLFVKVVYIPLNANNKVDIQALLKTGVIEAGFEREHVPPRTTAERIITKIWEHSLSRKDIGIHDNFFDLGGHSLTAARIQSKVTKNLMVNMKLSDIFLYPTVAQLAEHLSEQQQDDLVTPTVMAENGAYRASPSQRRIWAHAQFDAGKNIYNVPAAFRQRGDLDTDLFKGALDDLVARHESLRTFFSLQINTLEQSIVPICQNTLRVLDYSGEKKKEELALALVKAETEAPFDLSQAPLFRACLLKMNRHDHLFVFTIHHIISDGWSLDVLQRELSELYKARKMGVPHTLKTLPYQFKDFAAWQYQFLGTDPAIRLQSYWKRKLALPLPSNIARRISSAVDSQDFCGQTLTFSLDPELVRALRSLAKAQSNSLFMALLTCVKLLIFKYTSESDIVVGTPASGRGLPGLEGQIGCFINMLPLRDYIVDSSSFTEILDQVKQTSLEALDHQLYPLESMISDLGVTPDASTNPFFSIAVMIQQEQRQLALLDVEVTPVPVGKKTSVFDLVFEFIDCGDEVLLNLSYRIALFTKKRIERTWTHFEMLVAQIVKLPDDPVRALTIIPQAEFKQLRSLSTAASAPDWEGFAPTLVDAFNVASKKYASQTAIVSNGSSISYAELNSRTDALAYTLIKDYSIQSEDVVALLFEPSIDAVVAVWGVLKAGAAYVPLDPRWPVKRVEFVLDDCQCEILLCDMELYETASGDFSIPVLAINEILLPYHPPELLRRLEPDHLAYIIYTSGSAGHPKGVMIEHRAVLNLIAGLQSIVYSAYPTGLRVACIASLVFDASVQQIFGALLLGQTLYMIPDRLKRNPVDLIAMLRLNRIDVFDLTPSLFRILSHFCAVEDLSHSLKRLMIGGEILPPKLVNEFFAGQRNRSVTITNVYGPTESTVDVLLYDCLTDKKYKSIPVGTPLPNIRIYILDRHGNEVPLGNAGEICIAGAGLARGYSGSAGRSTEQFIAAPHLGEQRIYKTGDIGRWNDDNLVEFMGRLDRQVKLRGHRIELQEIEAKLLLHPDVQAAAVRIMGDGENQIIGAYFVSAAGLDQSSISAYLWEHLPTYMIPSYCIEIPAIPLNSSGKIDMAALPQPYLEVSQQLSAIEGQTEFALAAIWAKVLNIEDLAISGQSSFFELGGNSLTSAYVVSEIKEKLGISISLTDFYEHSDIRSLGLFIDQSKADPVPDLQEIDQEPTFDLTFQQKRIWIQCERSPNGTAYHMPGNIAFDRRPDRSAIREALQELVTRHDALRLRFLRIDHEIRQMIAEPGDLPLQFMNISREGDSKVARDNIITEELLKPFDFNKGPFFRFVVLEAPSGHELLYNFHHIIMDGWSLEILKEEFQKLYNGIVSNNRPKLMSVEHDYSEYARHLQRLLHDSASIQKASQFWKIQLSPGLPAPQTPRSAALQEFSNAGMGYGCRVDRDLIDSLYALAKKSNTTLAVILFSAYLQLIRRFYTSDHVASYIIHSGRDHVDFMNTVGVFVNPLLVIYRMDDGLIFRRVVRGIHEKVQELTYHQAYPVEFVLDRLGLPTYSVPFAFNMLNVPSLSEQTMLSDFQNYHRYDAPPSKFPIELYIKEYQNGMEMFWSFDVRHYDMSKMEYLGNEYVDLLRYLSLHSCFPKGSAARKALKLPGNADN